MRISRAGGEHDHKPECHLKVNGIFFLLLFQTIRAFLRLSIFFLFLFFELTNLPQMLKSEDRINSSV